MAKKETVYFKRSKYRKDDFALSDLPNSRGKQFFDIFKNDWKTLLFLGLILFLFSLPFLTLEFFRWFIEFNLPAQLESQGIDDATIYSSLQLTEVFYELLIIVTNMIIAIPLAGSARVLKRLVHGEGVLFKDDFLTGIKQNVGHFLLFMFIYSILRFSMQFTYIYIKNIPIVAEIVRGVTMGAFFVLFVPILLFMFCQDAIYKMSVWINFKNSYQLTIRSILAMLIFSFLIFGTYFIRYIPLIYVVLIVWGFLILISPIYLLSLSLFSMSKFDRYINKDNYPEVYRKGLRPDGNIYHTND